MTLARRRVPLVPVRCGKSLATTVKEVLARIRRRDRPIRALRTEPVMTTRSDRGGRLAVYVTSHGFGHLNRTAAVLNQVPADVPVTIRSHSNLFEHWHERLKRPAELEHYVCDVGAVNPPGDSNATDPLATIELAMRFHGEAMATVDDQVRRLREQQTAAGALRRAGRSPRGRPTRGSSRLSHEQLHLGRHLCALCPRRRGRGPAFRRRICARATARRPRLSGSSRP